MDREDEPGKGVGQGKEVPSWLAPAHGHVRALPYMDMHVHATHFLLLKSNARAGRMSTKWRRRFESCTCRRASPCGVRRSDR